jgi:hypothetical protein
MTRRGAAGLLLLCAPLAARAQSVVTTRPIGPVVARLSLSNAVPAIHTLSDGRVLVFDNAKSSVTLYDSLLANPRVVMDSAALRPASGRLGPGKFIRGLADSTLFFASPFEDLLVIDPRGSVAGRRAFPPRQPNEVGTLSANTVRTPNGGAKAVAPGFGLLYSLAGVSAGPPTGAPGQVVVVVGRAPIGMLDLTTGISTTLTTFLTGGVTRYTTTADPRRPTSVGIAGPFPVLDDWAVMTDGTVAIVHGRDYRIEWIKPDRSKSMSDPVSYPWQRLTAADKSRFVDSANTARQQSYDASVARSAAAGSRLSLPPPVPFEVAQIPDTLPALLTGTQQTERVMADPDNRLWVLARHEGSSVTRLIYDIVDRQGKLVDRVQLPENRLLMGIGPNGTVYMMVSGNGPFTLERARFK